MPAALKPSPVRKRKVGTKSAATPVKAKRRVLAADDIIDKEDADLINAISLAAARSAASR